MLRLGYDCLLLRFGLHQRVFNHLLELMVFDWNCKPLVRGGHSRNVLEKLLLFVLVQLQSRFSFKF